MSNIWDIDPNFKVNTTLEETDIRFFNIKKHPELLFGLMFDEERFRRMPEALGEAINKNVLSLSKNTSGGRLRFITDSPYIAISVKMSRNCLFAHMAQTGVSGFDLYVDGIFRETFFPSVPIEGGYDRIAYLKGEDKKRQILMHFPLYNYVEELYVGVKEGSCVEVAPAYAYEKPMVFYGSSITQGGCVSRGGLAYPAYISRWYDCDFINLGFSGNGKGELCMAEHIASLDPLVFVLDYDHNARDAEFLANTHGAFFKRFRELRPDTPVVMVSCPDLRFRSARIECREVIRRTYEEALAAGDQNVRFVDGETLWDGEDWDSCTVDNCHPNDLGHYRMAKVIGPVVKELLDKHQS